MVSMLLVIDARYNEHEKVLLLWAWLETCFLMTGLISLFHFSTNFQVLSITAKSPYKSDAKFTSSRHRKYWGNLGLVSNNKK